jgi:SAM-dependent methyltransferase
MMAKIGPMKMFRKIKWHISLWQLRGDTYFCPLCEKGFKTFLPGGPSLRPLALCPCCHSLERHRFLWLMLKHLWQEGTIAAGGRMLHFAPEPCLTGKFKRRFDYLSADLDPAAAMVAMDITDIRFPDESFDAIICNHVLEHISDDARALAELYRVLKRGGWASLQVPMRGETTYEDPTITTPEEREKAFGQADHIRYYGADYYRRLQAAGFRTEIYPKVDFFSPAEDARFALATETELVIARK